MLDKIVKPEELGVSEQELTNFVVRRAMEHGRRSPTQLAQHLADNDQLTLAMVEIVRDKAKSVIGDAAKIVDEAGNEVDLKAIYTEISGEEVVEEDAEEREAPAEQKNDARSLPTAHRAPQSCSCGWGLRAYLE